MMKERVFSLTNLIVIGVPFYNNIRSSALYSPSAVEKNLKAERVGLAL